ncbi:MAG: cytochrome c [Oceanobacter sp.]
MKTSNQSKTARSVPEIRQRRIQRPLSILLLVSLLSPLALAESQATVQATVQSGSLANQREDRFEQFEDGLDQLFDQVRGQEWSAAQASMDEANSHWRWLSGAFSEDQRGTGRLKKSIWKPGSDFTQRMQAVLVSLEKANSALVEKNKQAALQNLKDCKGCHRQYRSFW